PGDRAAARPLRAVRGRAGRGHRPGSARGAPTAERRLRAPLRLPVRRLRQPPAEGRDPRGAPRAHRTDAAEGARAGGRRAGRGRGGPVAPLVATYATDWLDLVFRWFHVTAAIVWIGTSFYFVALDNHLLEPERQQDRDEGVRGESWEIHGGGFYV